MSGSLWPHGLQDARLPCPSPIPRACSNSCPSSQWCHPIISSSDIPFSSCLQFFPASGSFPRSQFFASDSQSIGASASALVLPMNIQDWFPVKLTGLISLQSRDSQESSPTPQFKSINSLAIWCKELTPWKRSWCWERLKAGGEGDVRGWDNWMASLTRRTWVWTSSGNWWWTVHGVTKSQTWLSYWSELNWTGRYSG